MSLVIWLQHSTLFFIHCELRGAPIIRDGHTAVTVSDGWTSGLVDGWHRVLFDPYLISTLVSYAPGGQVDTTRRDTSLHLPASPRPPLIPWVVPTDATGTEALRRIPLSSLKVVRPRGIGRLPPRS